MTNCNYVRRVGKKSEKDVSIVLNSFQTMTNEEWLQMCGTVEVTQFSNVLSLEELRQARLNRFT